MLENFSERVNLAFGMSFGLVTGHFMATHKWDFAVGGLVVAIGTFVTAKTTMAAVEVQKEAADEIMQKQVFRDAQSHLLTLKQLTGYYPEYLPELHDYIENKKSHQELLLKRYQKKGKEMRELVEAAISTLPITAITNMKWLTLRYEYNVRAIEKKWLKKQRDNNFAASVFETDQIMRHINLWTEKVLAQKKLMDDIIHESTKENIYFVDTDYHEK